VLAAALRYWSAQLRGAPPHLELPTDRQRPAVASFGAEELDLTLSGALYGSLKKLASSENATLFMLLAAAFQVLLSCYSGQQDLVLGVPTTGRTHKQTGAMIGFFVNTLILRTDLSGNPTFRDLLRRVKAVAMGGYAYQYLPFEKLVMALCPERNLARQPIFQVMIALHNYPEEKLVLTGVDCTMLTHTAVAAKFDLVLHLRRICDTERGGSEGLRLIFEYATDLFDHQTIQRMGQHFLAFLRMFADDPACRVR